MEGVKNKEGIKGVMVSGDEIDKVIIREDKYVDVYMKGKGSFTFKFSKIERDPNATFYVGPREEHPDW